jgi:hypothetical protein
MEMRMKMRKIIEMMMRRRRRRRRILMRMMRITVLMFMTLQYYACWNTWIMDSGAIV